MKSRFPAGILFIVTFALLLRLLVALYFFNNPAFEIQQDHYADYAEAIRLGSLDSALFPVADTRLLPGYPIMIYLLTFVTQSDFVSGFLISLFSALLAIVVFWILTKNTLATLLFSFFPPIWVKQAVKITTEPVVTLLLLGSFLIYLRNKFLLSGVIVGFAFTVRFIAAAFLFALFIDLARKRNIAGMKQLLAGFISIASLLFVFNILTFGSENALHQFVTYTNVAGGTIGAVQVVEDLFRAFDWKQYRILVSGSLYLLLFASAFFVMYRIRNASSFFYICFYWLLFSFLFIFSFGPTPMLEEFSRFAVPVVPVMIVALSHLLQMVFLKDKSLAYGQKS